MTRSVEVFSFPARINLGLVRGTDGGFEFALTSGADPVDITNDEVRLTVLTAPAGDVLLQTTNAPGSHEDPSNGITRFDVPRAVTALSPANGTAYWPYEVRRIDGVSGEEFVHVRGNLVVEPGIGV